jgi:hypothetical protein
MHQKKSYQWWEGCMIFFGDDTEFISRSRSGKSPDVFCIGGFGISDFACVVRIEELIDSVKVAHDIPVDLPVKWNMKDNKVKKLYREKGQEALLKQISADFDDIRKEIMQELPQLGIRIIVSSIRNLGQTKNQLYEWGFTALLQRFGLSAKTRGETINFIVLDWEEEKRDVYCEVYQRAYSVGRGRGEEPYLSGPFKNIPAIPYLSFSVTVYNSLLQLADFVVGCTGDFLKSCYTGRNNRNVRRFFPFIRECLERSGGGQILNWGLIVQPRGDRIIVNKNL